MEESKRLGKLKLFDDICHDPLSVSKQQVFYWAQHPYPDEAINFNDLRTLMLRIFDQNEKSLEEASDASTGGIGFANKLSTKRRLRVFKRKINKGFRKGNNKIVVAEGDSWFQFPFFIKDILDHLIDKDDAGVYSMAFGGDWLTNIIYEGKYVEELSVVAPDAFLLSGGGNDLLGSSRLSVMVDRNAVYTHKYTTAEDIVTVNSAIHNGNLHLLRPYDADKIIKAQPFIKKELYSFLWVIYLQFFMIMKGFQKSPQLLNMLVVTQAYDYAIPYKGFRFDWRYPHQPLVNWFTGSGKWLFTPLMLKGFISKEERDAIVHTCIFEFNLKLMDIAQLPDFPNLVHIDCRGNAKSHDDWFDELHLKSHVFKRVANVFYDCIRSYGKNKPEKEQTVVNKIIKVIDYSGIVNKAMQFTLQDPRL